MKCTKSVLPLLAAALLGLSSLGTPARAQEGQEKGTWAFSYPDDTRPGALLDLRSLNEKTAGESGFVRLSPDGGSFVLGNGKPVRFWACGLDYHGTDAEMARKAHFLARLGVNMVRLHAQIAPDDGGPITGVNAGEVDAIWRTVAAMKKEGIYATISPYWANGKKAGLWGIDGYSGQTDLWGLLFFNETLQAGYKAWVKALYARPNPYTGVTLAKDPAVAIIQVQNEDGMFFWTMQGMKPEQQALLGRKFAAWLSAKYGTPDAAKTAWAGASQPGDDWAGGKVGILPTWQLTQAQTGGSAARVADQVHFFADTQKKWYTDVTSYYKNTLGCGQLVNASNWFTADPVKLNDAERYTYTAADVVAVNKYYDGGVHQGPDAGWRIDPGDHFNNVSALLNPRGLPTNLKQVAGHPMIVTESSWVAPLGYQSEGPFLMAAYQSLTGVDAFYWFSVDGSDGYVKNPQFPWAQVNGQYGLNKWSANVPPLLGEFPACALLFRQGYLKQGTPVIHEERPLTDLWERKTPLIAEDGSFDPNRAGTAATQSASASAAAPYAFLVGPVEVKYGGDPAKTRVTDLSPYVDTQNGVVKSETGQIRLNYHQGVCVINAPQAQGATGFLSKSGPLALADVTLTSGNAYATVLAVSLDGLPLKTSRRVLVQVGTAARPTGWEVKAADFTQDKQTLHGYEVVHPGAAPWQVINTDVTLSIGNSGLSKATLLDAAGYAAGPVPVTKANGRMTLTLPADAMYVVLE